MKSILLVEDNEDDIALVKTAYQRCGFAHSLQVVRNGREAIAYLSGGGQYADRATHPLPHLVLLDIRMPEMDGFAVLQWIRSQPQFSSLPVVMLTVSKSEHDLQRAYALGLNSFLRKGDSMKELEHEIRTVFDYWLVRNIGPK